MLITLHDESIDIEVGQKVIFYHYQLNDNNELEVLTDETYVDVIDKKNNIVGFKNNVHSSTLHFYQNDTFGKRFFLNDTKENRLRFLGSKVKFHEKEQKLLDDDIKDAYELLAYRKRHMEEVKQKISSINTLIEELNKGLKA